MNRIVQRLAPALVAICALTTATAAETRDRLHIVGSSTVFPYTNVVADNLAAPDGKPRRFANTAVAPRPFGIATLRRQLRLS